jgi:hypothetical protein
MSQRDKHGVETPWITSKKEIQNEASSGYGYIYDFWGHGRAYLLSGRPKKPSTASIILIS